MKQQFFVFLVRWVLNALGLWIAVRILGTGYNNVDVTAGFWGFLLAGLIFSLINSFLKPLFVIVSLPAIILTLGLFTFQAQRTTEWALLMAGSVLVTLPLIIVFVFTQRYFVQGISMTGIKG